LIAEEQTRPRKNARANVLFQIQRYAKKVRESKQWNREEKEELLRFLAVQADGWGLLGEKVGPSREVLQAKEDMLLKTWQKFTEGMESRQVADRSVKKGLLKRMPQKAKQAKKRDLGLETELSTTGIVVHGDVKIISHGVEAPVSSHEPVGQTVAHDESENSVDTPKEGKPAPQSINRSRKRSR
jgi:hypothetical protein